MPFDADIPNDDLIPYPTTCWRTKTLFQSGLILILMVAVPFFILMVLVYILTLSMTSESEKCNRLCGTLLQWRSYRPYDDISDYPDSLHAFNVREKVSLESRVTLNSTATTGKAEKNKVGPRIWNEDTLEMTEDWFPPQSSNQTEQTKEEIPTEVNFFKQYGNSTIRTEIPTEVNSFEQYGNSTIRTEIPTEINFFQQYGNSTIRTEIPTEINFFEQYANSTINLAREKEESTLSPAPRLPRSATFQNTSSCFHDRPKFPSVAALLQNLYMDDEEEQILKCSVVVLSPSWVLTIDECIENDVRSLFVRINSDYWSQGGLVKKVEKVIRFRKLVAIRLVQESEDYLCFKPVNISKTPGVTEGQILFWNGKINQALKTRSKFGRIMTISADIKKTESRFFPRDNVSQFGAPLLDQDENLIGFQLHHERKDKGLPYRSTDEYFIWIEIIKKSL